MTKDTELVRKRFEQDLADLIPLMDHAVVLEKLTPEQRLAGVPESEQVLALSDTLLHALPAGLLATLPEDVQAKVRARLAR